MSAYDLRMARAADRDDEQRRRDAQRIQRASMRAISLLRQARWHMRSSRAAVVERGREMMVRALRLLERANGLEQGAKR